MIVPPLPTRTRQARNTLKVSSWEASDTRHLKDRNKYYVHCGKGEDGNKKGEERSGAGLDWNVEGIHEK